MTGEPLLCNDRASVSFASAKVFELLVECTALVLVVGDRGSSVELYARQQIEGR